MQAMLSNMDGLRPMCVMIREKQRGNDLHETEAALKQIVETST